jgi:hypothetical protein
LAEFQSFIFGQILANFGKFGQFWADFPAFTVAESMPELGQKSSKPHNFSTVSPNITCNGSLESYNPYLLPQKLSKNPQKNYNHSSLPKPAKSRFGLHCPLGVKVQRNIHCEKELKKTMARLAMIVLNGRNFYNFFGCN